MMKRALRAAALVCAIAAGTVSAHAGDNLSSADLKRLFPGRFQGVVHGVVEVTITASRGGRLTGSMMGENDTGRWRVRNGQLCLAWNDWTEGRYVCSSVSENGGWFHANSGGPIRFRKL